MRIFNQAASTHCSNDNKEKLCTIICSEFVISRFCHDVAPLRLIASLATAHKNHLNCLSVTISL